MVGVQVTSDSVNVAIGTITRRLADVVDDIAALEAWSSITPQEAIEALGFSSDDAYLVKLIIQDLAGLRAIYVGAAALAVAKDFREQTQKAVGLGV